MNMQPIILQSKITLPIILNSFFIKDAGTVQIDHTILELKANSILFLSPYQRHQWKLTHGTEGFII